MKIDLFLVLAKTFQHLLQVAFYYLATRKKPHLVVATEGGYYVYTPDNCNQLKPKNLEKYFMSIAMNLAKDRVGLTGLNPSVGCLIVKNDEIVSICLSRDKFFHTAPSCKP